MSGKTPLVFVKETIDAVAYADMLETTFVPFMEEYYPNGMVFLQDDAPAHNAKHTKYLLYDGRDGLNGLDSSPSRNEFYR